MILKQPALEGLNAGINPVARVMQVLAVERIGSNAQQLGDRATQFVKGQEYIAQVLSKVGGSTYNVQVDGAILKLDLGTAAQAGQTLQLRYLQDSPTRTFVLGQSSGIDPKTAQLVRGQEYLGQVLSRLGDTTYSVKVDAGGPNGIVLKMELGSAAQAGQKLTLRYMQDSPVPTFFLSQTPAKNDGTSTILSPAASLIGQYLQKAEGEGVSARFEATSVVTHSPKNPQVMAQDLRQAVSSSGLFYESHLGEMVQGNRTLAAVMQEPQNQANSPVAALMAQQLAILENQRMSWHGEVWPGQKMEWDVYLQQRDAAGEDSQQAAEADEQRPISSELTLHLPYLGTVSARLTLADGRMRISILAEKAETLTALTSQRQSLAEAITNNGQQLDALMVARHE